MGLTFLHLKTTVASDSSSPYEESDADRRRGIVAGTAISLDLVSALAGDRPSTEAETKRLSDLKKSRGLRFFSDVLYSISHQYFPPETAEGLWTKVLRHKRELSTELERKPRIGVAALDYLSNITANMCSPTLVGETHMREIVGLSLRDGLTGLFNHTYFYQQIELEMRRHVRYGALVSLVLIDIDDFKKVNDTYGHQEGDRILAAMGRTLLRVTRGSDICCRYGGEEFAVILPMTEVHAACVIANRLKMELAERLPGGRTVTVSIGVASCGRKARTYRDVVEKADAALYQAKGSGKNRVVVADGQGASEVNRSVTTKGGEARGLTTTPASPRSVHDGPSGRSRYRDPSDSPRANRGASPPMLVGASHPVVG
jgi:diguanylate cyclase (GGDEF)-like protein